MKVEKDRLDKYLKKINSSSCPLCGNQKWVITGDVFQVSDYKKKGDRSGGAILPVVPIICTNCGNILFINALVAKLIDPPNEDDKASDCTKG